MLNISIDISENINCRYLSKKSNAYSTVPNTKFFILPRVRLLAITYIIEYRLSENFRCTYCPLVLWFSIHKCVFFHIKYFIIEKSSILMVVFVLIVEKCFDKTNWFFVGIQK